MCSVAVVIPTYNHATALSSVLDQILGLGLLCIVVNDGSTDETKSVLKHWEASDQATQVVVRSHQRNRGKAAAMSTGFDEARSRGFTHAATIDSDGQLDPEDIPKLIKVCIAHPEALILGTRPEFIPGCPSRCSIGRHHAGLAVYAQTGRRFADTQCGLRVYPLELLERVACHAGRFAFEAEIITRTIWSGCQVIEVPVLCTYEPSCGRTSHFRPFLDSLLQGITHTRLLLHTLVPWFRAPKDSCSTRSRQGIFRRLIGWLNPFRCWRDLRDSDVGSLELGAAVGLGAWIGTLPFFGLHTVMCLYVSWRFHLRPAAMVLGSQISAPPLGVLLAIVSVTLGHLLITGTLPASNQLSLEWSSVVSMSWHIFLAWLIGSIIIGFLIGLTLFGLLQLLLPRFRAKPPPTANSSDTFNSIVEADGGESTIMHESKQPGQCAGGDTDISLTQRVSPIMK